MPKPPTKTEIAKQLADKINAHLKRFEASPEINHRPSGKLKPYYCASARGDRHRVMVVYISFQGSSHLSLEEAQRYLTWLDAGNVGRHYEALREPT